MKITFIKPNIGNKNNRHYFDTGSMQPLTIAVLAGLTPPEHEVAFYDDRMEKIPYDKPADLAGITVETFTAKRAYEISNEFRRRGTPVVLGGFHPTLIPEEAAEYADAVVIGEAEGVWEEVLDDAKNKKLRKFYKSSARPSLSGVIPRRAIFKGKKYLPLTLVEFGRGCNHTCEFCAISAFYQKSYNNRPPKEVADEISTDHKSTAVFFIDDNIAANPDEAKKLFKLLIPLKIRWAGQISIDFANDDELLDLIVKSGCMGLVVGIETLDKNNLIQMNKDWNMDFGGYETALNKIRKKGLMIWAAFLYGYDYDSRDIFDSNFDFALKHKFAFIATNQLMPYPGTPLYDKFLTENRLIYDKWWLDGRYRFGHAAFKPKRMSANELTEYCVNIRKKLYGYCTIFNRLFDGETNCRNLFNAAIFLKYNLLFRKEMFKKQDMKFGGVSSFEV